MHLLPDITPGQGSMLSGFFTAVGAVLGIIVASQFFSGKVRTLKEALDESRTLVEQYQRSVQLALESLATSIEQVSVQASGLASGVGRIESDIVELSEQSESSEAVTVADSFRAMWLAIRDELERRASSDEIDGRTRAAYGRVDRRSYYDLIRKMEDGGTLSSADAKDCRRAYELWQRFKNGRAKPSDGETETMTSIRSRVVAP